MGNFLQAFAVGMRGRGVLLSGPEFPVSWGTVTGHHERFANCAACENYGLLPLVPDKPDLRRNSVPRPAHSKIRAAV